MTTRPLDLVRVGAGVEDIESAAQRVADQHDRPLDVGGGEQIVDLGDHLGRVARHRRRVAAPWKGGVGEGDGSARVGCGDHRARPVVDAHPVGCSEGGKARRVPVCR